MDLANNHRDKLYSINPDGHLCFDDQELDSDLILFEEEAKNLLERELMEGLLFYYPEDEEDYSMIEDEDLEQNTEDNSIDNEVNRPEDK